MAPDPVVVGELVALTTVQPSFGLVILVGATGRVVKRLRGGTYIPLALESGLVATAFRGESTTLIEFDGSRVKAEYDCRTQVRAACPGGFVGFDREFGSREQRSVARVRVQDGARTVWKWVPEEGGFPPGEWDFDVCVLGSHVYLGKGEHLCALDLQTGRLVWAQVLGQGVRRKPLVGGGGVIVRAKEGLIAFDQRTGRPLWKSEGTGSYAVTDEVVATVDRTGRFCVRHLQDGRSLTEFDLAKWLSRSKGFRARWNERWVGPLNVIDGTAIFGDETGLIWAVSVATAEPLWLDRPRECSGFWLGEAVKVNDGFAIVAGAPGSDKPQVAYCYDAVRPKA